MLFCLFLIIIIVFIVADYFKEGRFGALFVQNNHQCREVLLTFGKTNRLVPEVSSLTTLLRRDVHATSILVHLTRSMASLIFALDVLTEHGKKTSEDLLVCRRKHPSWGFSSHEVDHRVI